MKLIEFEKHLFRIAHIQRQPKPGENWNRFHKETKQMLMVYLAEETSLKAAQIGELFGMKKTNNHAVPEAKADIDPETYKEFKKVVSELMELHVTSSNNLKFNV